MIRIKVTKNDIRNGEIGNGCHCPIAKACRRAAKIPPKNGGIWIGKFGTFKINGVSYKASYAEARVIKFINDFDSGRDVKPFEFCLYENKGE